MKDIPLLARRAITFLVNIAFEDVTENVRIQNAGDFMKFGKMPLVVALLALAS
jgi:hypothetical protein